MTKNKENNIQINIVIIAMLLLAISLIVTGVSLGEANAKLDIFKEIYSIDSESADEYSLEADEYYTLASDAYIYEEWDEVVSYCLLSRDKRALAAEGYREISIEYEDSDVEVLRLYSELYAYAEETEWNLFEACEHFESAAKYYKIYYDPATSYNEASFDMGNGEIESMNEKIRLHDSNVHKYNDVLTRVNKELLKLLEN